MVCSGIQWLYVHTCDEYQEDQDGQCGRQPEREGSLRQDRDHAGRGAKPISRPAGQSSKAPALARGVCGAGCVLFVSFC